MNNIETIFQALNECLKACDSVYLPLYIGSDFFYVRVAKNEVKRLMLDEKFEEHLATTYEYKLPKVNPTGLFFVKFDSQLVT